MENTVTFNSDNLIEIVVRTKLFYMEGIIEWINFKNEKKCPFTVKSRKIDHIFTKIII